MPARSAGLSFSPDSSCQSPDCCRSLTLSDSARSSALLAANLPKALRFPWTTSALFLQPLGIVQVTVDVFLLNHLTKARVNRPPSSKTILFLIVSFLWLFMITNPGDDSWASLHATLEDEEDAIGDIVHHDEKVFVLTNKSEFLAFDLTGPMPTASVLMKDCPLCGDDGYYNASTNCWVLPSCESHLVSFAGHRRSPRCEAAKPSQTRVTDVIVVKFVSVDSCGVDGLKGNCVYKINSYGGDGDACVETFDMAKDVSEHGFVLDHYCYN